MPDVFDIKNLSLWYLTKSEQALTDVSLHISPNSINVLLGQNGSGKSSLLKCIAGIQTWNEGDIIRNSISRQYDMANFNSDIILLSEDIILPNLGIKDLEKIYTEIWPSFNSTLFQNLLNLGEINLNKKFQQLSRGQKILVQFSLALATQCKTILIDEVTATLDPYVRARVASEIVIYQKKYQATIIMATNIATEFPNEDVRLILMKKGSVFTEGLLSNLKNEFVKYYTSSIETNSQPKAVFLKQVSDKMQFIIRKSDIENSNLEKDLAETTLEEIFVYISDRKGS